VIPSSSMKFCAPAILIIAVLVSCPARAQRLAPFSTAAPFTATLSNNTPLAFGMAPPDAARALASKLNYVSGRPGNEIFVAWRHHGGSELLPRNDRLYLQFRKGRLTGWKGDWGSHWMWQ
jgi:hypothetical protein